MARSNNNGNHSKVSGKIRFIMLEADIEDGNLTEIAQAISNAVRPASIIQQVIQAPALPRAIESHPTGKATGSPQTALPLTESEDTEILEDVPATPPASKRQSRDETPRHFPQPQPIDGINWSGNGTSFKDFANNKKPTSHIKRFLVTAAWFREHNSTPTVTIEHLFTAYGMMRWPWVTDKDMTAHFREGMRPTRRWYAGDGKGNYTVTDLGVNEVDGMPANNRSGD